MATHTITTEQAYDSTPEVWSEFLRTLAAGNTPSNPLRRWGRWLGFHWKPVVLSLAFWAIYGCASALLATR